MAVDPHAPTHSEHSHRETRVVEGGGGNMTWIILAVVLAVVLIVALFWAFGNGRDTGPDNGDGGGGGEGGGGGQQDEEDQGGGDETTAPNTGLRGSPDAARHG